MIKIGLISLGCDKNTVDSEAILALFNNSYFSFTNELEDADCVLINTCGFILDAKKEAIDTIFEVKRDYPKAKIVVLGCLVERYKEELEKELTEVDLFISFKDYDRILEKVSELFEIKLSQKFDLFNRVRSTPRYTAFLKISEGCSNFCGFCAIPFIRGPFHSFPLDSLVEEAQKMSEEGVKEIIVVSQDTGRYGRDFKDQNVNLVTLLKELDKIEGIEFIRLLYLYPEEVTDDLIDFINSSSKLTHYFDIPIQHCSNKVLKAMLRRDKKEDLISLFERIKERVDNPILRTTLIVGYPQEEEEDFNELLDFIKTYQFNHLGVFKYSKEEGTYGATFKDQIEESVKEERYNTLMTEQKKIAHKLNKEQIGKVYKALITKKLNSRSYLVRCGLNLSDDLDGKIYLNLDEDKILNEGDIVTIEIVDAFTYDLVSKIKN